MDITGCDLVVEGTLTVNLGITLKAKNISATSTTANGINNAGTMTVTNKIYGNGYETGIYNQSAGKIESSIMEGMQSAPSQDAEGNYIVRSIILNDGTMNIDTVISSAGTTLGSSFQNNGTGIVKIKHLIGVSSGIFYGTSNSNIMEVDTIDL